MKPTGIFFIIFFIICITISVLFYFLFRRKPLPLPSYSYFPNKPAGLPGMQKKLIEKPIAGKQMYATDSGKPTAATPMPIAPAPLIAKAVPAGPPARKKMME